MNPKNPLEGWEILSPGEQVAQGLVQPGPLAPAIKPGQPEQNKQAIREVFNPAQVEHKVKTGIQGAIQSGDKFLAGLRSSIQTPRSAGEEAASGLPGMEVAKNIFNPIPGSVAQAAATAATLPFGGGLFSGPLKRSLAAGAAGGAVEGIQGKNPFTAGLKYAIPQAVAEVPFALGRGILNQRALGKAEAQKTALEASDKEAFERAVKQTKRDYQLAKIQQKTDFAAQQRQHAEKGAAIVAGHFKERVPAFKDMPANEAGLIDMVYGTGQKRLSENFETAMSAALESAKDKTVKLTGQDLVALGVFNELPAGMPPNLRVDVPADSVIKSMTGKSQSARFAYRHAAEALDAAGIGTQAARDEYRVGQALINFTDKSGMIRGGQFDPEAAMKGLTTLKTVDQLRRRGEGSAVEGPISEAARGIPQKPGPLTPPEMPTAPQPRELPEGFKTREVPDFVKRHPWASAALGAGATGAALGTGQHGAGLAFDAGLLGAGLLGGKKIATQAPINPLLDILLRLGGVDLGAGLRGNIRNEP